MRSKIVLGFLVVFALSALPFAANQAHADQQTAAVAAPRIDGFDVEPVAKPIPGNELTFAVYGSPGGSVTVKIDGATGGLALVETEPGVYEGTYTIRKRDRITATSTATANLRLGNRVVSAIVDEPLVGRAVVHRTGPRGHTARGPKIDHFDASPLPRLDAGEELVLTLSGTPGGTASARIAGIKGKLVLDEIRSGVYEGSYTIKNRDRIAADATVTGVLRVGSEETSAVLGRSLLASESHPSGSHPAARPCVNCGVVEAINVVEVKGQGSYVGKIAGGVAGALIGSQIGAGRGTTLAEVAGAAGGAYAGNEIEKRVKTTKQYEVVVRLENGGTQTFSYAEQPGFAVGSKVKVVNGALETHR
jgi:outer membrane lipoprotein SlyB